ncbi:MAG TPA: hypothetical protein VMV33_11870 [Rhodocyclaceae bacterium]|nr:hypothetical protein [Rhodocyclaceae bacterium]
MSVSNVSLNSGAAVSAWQSTKHQALQDFDQLFQAMQSGSLSGAQQAYSALQQLQPSAPTATTGSAAAATTGTVATDWSSLGTALQSGSLSSAQSAFAKLQQDLVAATAPDLNQAQAVYAAMQGTAPGSGISAASAVSTDLSALQQALQSGNTSSAQSVLAKLEQDLQSSGVAALHHRHHHHGMSAQAATSAYAGSQPAAAVGSIASRGAA